jgi:hypothetical protein
MEILVFFFCLRPHLEIVDATIQLWVPHGVLSLFPERTWRVSKKWFGTEYDQY